MKGGRGEGKQEGRVKKAKKETQGTEDLSMRPLLMARGALFLWVISDVFTQRLHLLVFPALASLLAYLTCSLHVQQALLTSHKTEWLQDTACP